MDNGLEKILEFIEEEDAKFIRLAFRDAYGIQKNISVMPSEIAKACKFGIPINAREITGFRDSEESSLYLKPDPTTMAVLPWRPDSGRVIRLFCDVYTASGENFSQDSRYILKDAMEKAKKAGINFKFGSEAEF